jgi:LysM repeat protein
MKTQKKVFLILITICISTGLLVSTFQPVSAAVKTPEKCTRWHTVQKGEYLSKIADQYDTNWYTLAEINQLTNPSLVFAGNKLCIFHSDFSGSSPVYTPTTTTQASVVATSVKEDQAVTLQGKNLVADARYVISLGKYKNIQEIGYSVGSVYTNKDGAFTITVTIPKKLYDVLKIRASLTDKLGKTTSNWFINTTSKGNTGGIGTSDLNIDIQSVKKGNWVKIETENLPANVSFNVYINRSGANENKAIYVGILRDSKGGKVLATYEIPAKIQDRSKLEIFAVNKGLDMEAEAVFDNKTTK